MVYSFQVFGIQLVELEDKFKGSFILVNKIETDTEQSHLEWYDLLSNSHL